MHNTCEDSLLASPLIVDLVLLTELMTRISIRVENASAKNEPYVLPDTSDQFKKFNSVLSFLSYMLKAPLVPNGAPIVNALFRQRNAIENLFRACLGLSPDSELMLENRI
jgi:myo-inositol-1-phosphate synthase